MLGEILVKELKVEDFPTPSSLNKKKVEEEKLKKDYSIAKYINIHSDEVIERVMGELKDQVESGISEPRSNILWLFNQKDRREMVDYWGNSEFPQDILTLPWLKLMNKGWDVEYRIGKDGYADRIYGWVYINPQRALKPKFSLKMEFN